jgi:hypothetical protein
MRTPRDFALAFPGSSALSTLGGAAVYRCDLCAHETDRLQPLRCIETTQFRECERRNVLLVFLLNPSARFPNQEFSTKNKTPHCDVQPGLRNLDVELWDYATSKSQRFRQ